MAFPVPAHLPRRTDISTSILTAASEATPKTLSAANAAEWVSQLEAAVRQTKTDVHKRIKDDLPNFERLLDTSKSVQVRLGDLSIHTHVLSDKLSNSDTGLIPQALSTLSRHNTLAKQAADARVLSDALNYLFELRSSSEDLRGLVSEGRLLEASTLLKEIDASIFAAPRSLAGADVVKDLKGRLRTVDHRISEQLDSALKRCLSVSSSALAISPVVSVPPGAATIELSSIYAALPPSSVETHLATLRRDLTVHYINFLLTQPTSLTVTGDTATAGSEASYTFNVFLAPPNDKDPTHRLANISTFLTFLNDHLFPHLPVSNKASFTASLSTPLTQALIHRLLEPLLPSTAGDLPGYLRLIEGAVKLEDDFIGPVLGDHSHEYPVAHWVKGLVGHYERKRRVAFFEHARRVITAPEGGFGTFEVEISIKTGISGVEVVQVTSPLAPETQEVKSVDDDVQGHNEPMNGPAQPNGHVAPKGAEADADSWGLDDDDATHQNSTHNGTPHPAARSPVTGAKIMSASSSVSSLADTDADEDAWGFDDGDGDAGSSPMTAPTEDLPLVSVLPATKASDSKADTFAEEPPPAIVPETTKENPIEDDPWADDPWADPPPSAPKPPLAPSASLNTKSTPIPAPAPVKRATRLERLANKGKSNVPSPTSSPAPVPATSFHEMSASSGQPLSSQPPLQSSVKTTVTKPPPAPVRTTPLILKEHYIASTRAQHVLDLVRSMVVEAEELASSDVFDGYASASASHPGAIIAQSASAVLDLYRALYPIFFASQSAQSSRDGMKLGNDALFLSTELEKIQLDDKEQVLQEAAETLKEAKEHMRIFAGRAYDDCVGTQEGALEDLLGEANGFEDCGDPAIYDRCEDAISRAVRQIRSVAHQWKIVLNKSRYYTSIGQLVETMLNRVLGDVLELDDITEDESRKLAELCRILSALEGLFVENVPRSLEEDPESFVVAYVPSWLKFSYLSVLLEASMADIQYLFDDGALVDFDGEELAKLVRALFADTPHRSKMVARLMQGHPERG